MINVEVYRGLPVTEQAVEIVERKGTGHPDQMCDSIMEAISVALARTYLKEFGVILHYNIDKCLLAAGRVEKRFGGGRVLEPMELTIGDRATYSAFGKELPIREIAVEAAQTWLRENLRRVDPTNHIQYRVKLAPGSEELSDIFRRPGDVRCANDTSAAVGYYPLSPTELTVLAVEHELNSAAFKRLFPETGEDVKVMGLRRGNTLDLTVAMPLLAERIESEKEYFDRKQKIYAALKVFLSEQSGFSEFGIGFNTLDQPGRGLGGVYLSLLGTSAEDADSGQVGRGNRVNGIIPMGRPIGTEAAAGKNPMSHVGKIYNVLAHRLARAICERFEGVRGAYVLLLSRIGEPIDQPLMASAQLILEKGVAPEPVARRVEEMMAAEFAGINAFCLALANGAFSIC
ncbi:methionine adenosyltransferase [Geomesophilobacter sediminis]|uniref:Methionine adenosyltransferase n=1 Tax=Geomesophilobacter sediminis TaxID=2798584 RepID=A0A8J7S786_9BACT|nr:methionine adenosyltransferase [Geomesophilobacter sediminis]MBJ6726896.1 methionine adenosyltransferase [Geomesophilobacter sediminis]